MTAAFIQGDAGRLPFPDKSFDLVFGSPPYTDARTYGIDAQRGCQEWIEWMLAVTSECLRVSRGAVVWVVGGTTRDRSYQPAAEGLMYRWFCESGVIGCDMYRPCFWHRVGIPGSGGDQWFRADVEYVLCFKRKGKLPWTDNVACGHKPTWGQGGAMSNRAQDGGRAQIICRVPRRNAKGDRDRKALYPMPEKSNPGNLIQTKGGQLGDSLAHQNEAPFPEDLVKRFVLSLCPPGGIVLDPFSGSGTTVAVARDNGCHGIGADLRMSQCELGRKRTAQEVFDFDAK